MNRIIPLLGALFRCSHRKTTFPITVTRSQPPPGQPRKCTYVVCLGCGRELEYDWNTMSIRHEPKPAH